MATWSLPPFLNPRCLGWAGWVPRRCCCSAVANNRFHCFFSKAAPSGRLFCFHRRAGFSPLQVETVRGSENFSHGGKREPRCLRKDLTQRRKGAKTQRSDRAFFWGVLPLRLRVKNRASPIHAYASVRGWTQMKLKSNGKNHKTNFPGYYDVVYERDRNYQRIAKTL